MNACSYRYDLNANIRPRVEIFLTSATFLAEILIPQDFTTTSAFSGNGRAGVSVVIVGRRVGGGFTVASVSSVRARAKTTSIRYSIELLRKAAGEGVEDRTEVKLSSGKGCVRGRGRAKIARANVGNCSARPSNFFRINASALITTLAVTSHLPIRPSVFLPLFVTAGKIRHATDGSVRKRTGGKRGCRWIQAAPISWLSFLVVPWR